MGGNSRRRHFGISEVCGKVKAIRQCRDEACIGSGILATQVMIEMGDVQPEACLRRKVVQHVQQANRIGAARNGNHKGAGGEQLLVPTVSTHGRP
jgi:hypothetical protein